MLDAFRRNSKSTLIYLFFGVIIVVFVVNFGPGAGQGGSVVRGGEFAAKRAGLLGRSAWEVSENCFIGDDQKIYSMGTWGSPQLATGLYVHPSTGEP